MHCPVDYGLCCQTVTVYRKEEDSVQRQVVDGCYLQIEDVQKEHLAGGLAERKFLLIMPGDRQRVYPGDRIYDGIGPEVDENRWPMFIPATVPMLVEAEYVKPFCWQGQLCHVEAGRRAPTW